MSSACPLARTFSASGMMTAVPVAPSGMAKSWSASPSSSSTLTTSVCPFCDARYSWSVQRGWGEGQTLLNQGPSSRGLSHHPLQQPPFLQNPAPASCRQAAARWGPPCTPAARRGRPRPGPCLQQCAARGRRGFWRPQRWRRGCTAGARPCSGPFQPQSAAASRRQTCAAR